MGMMETICCVKSVKKNKINVEKMYKMHKKTRKSLGSFEILILALCNLIGYNSGCKWRIVVDSGKLWWIYQETPQGTPPIAMYPHRIRAMPT
ncbi:MAG: hypothetical protein NC347_11780 [Clostridium sp.]|nr:hypothetical protein [Clostridium sp.]